MEASATGFRSPDAIVELIRGLHPEIKRKLRARLGRILEEPTVGKAPKDELEGLRSLRLGRLRVIYRLDESRVVEVSRSVLVGASTRRP